MTYFKIPNIRARSATFRKLCHGPGAANGCLASGAIVVKLVRTTTFDTVHTVLLPVSLLGATDFWARLNELFRGSRHFFYVASVTPYWPAVRADSVFVSLPGSYVRQLFDSLYAELQKCVYAPGDRAALERLARRADSHYFAWNPVYRTPTARHFEFDSGPPYSLRL